MASDEMVSRWDDVPLEKVTEMVSRKIVGGYRHLLAQVYLKRGAHVPMHVHDSDQTVYVLQGVLRYFVDGREITVRAGEVLHIKPEIPHQAEVIDDTFALVVFSPIPDQWIRTS